MNSLRYLISCYEATGIPARSAIRFICRDRMNARNHRHGHGNRAVRRARLFGLHETAGKFCQPATVKSARYPRDDRYEHNWRTSGRESALV